MKRSRQFYDVVLRPLSIVRIVDFEDHGSDYGAMAGPLGVELTITVEKNETMIAPGMHICFRAPDRAAVHVFSIIYGRVSADALPTHGYLSLNAKKDQANFLRNRREVLAPLLPIRRKFLELF